MHFRVGKGCLPKLLEMSVAFNWVRPQSCNFMRMCRASGTTSVHVGASVCLFVCL